MCATSCATTYSASGGGSCTSRQLSRISPFALQLPHSLRAFDSRTDGAVRADAAHVIGDPRAPPASMPGPSASRRRIRRLRRSSCALRMAHGEVEQVGRDRRAPRRVDGERELLARGTRSARPISIRAASRRAAALRHSASERTIHRARSTSAASMSRSVTQRGARTVSPSRCTSMPIERRRARMQAVVDRLPVEHDPAPLAVAPFCRGMRRIQVQWLTFALCAPVFGLRLIGYLRAARSDIRAWGGEGALMRTEPRHFVFDPALDGLHQACAGSPPGRNRRADRQRNRAGALAEDALRPQPAGVMRDRAGSAPASRSRVARPPVL